MGKENIKTLKILATVNMTLCMHMRYLSTYVQLGKKRRDLLTHKSAIPYVAKPSQRHSRVASGSPVAAVTRGELQGSVLVYAHKNKINTQTK